MNRTRAVLLLSVALLFFCYLSVLPWFDRFTTCDSGILTADNTSSPFHPADTPRDSGILTQDNVASPSHHADTPRDSGILTQDNTSSPSHTADQKLLSASSAVWVGRGQLNNVSTSSGSRSGSRSSRLLGHFSPQLSVTERDQLSRILAGFVEVCERNNISFWMFAGTLLGSYRHHGMIPWDDDVDLIVDISQKAQLEPALENQLPGELGFWTNNKRWKIWLKELSRSINRPSIPWRFPYLDISFYELDSGNVTAIVNSPFYSYPQSQVFPLVRRPFWGFWLPAPRCTHRILAHEYQLNICSTHIWSHREERPLSEVISLPCSDLHLHFPFVTRPAGGDTWTNETLMLAGETLQWVRVDNCD